ncbi:Curli biogenesis system outer membrane secretion channel CsgG [Noviherbaspirillum humi]|uniref:Curli biogenesis system outer membrane secretion channel CsgG n=2 Tax=Noviherbaspirillum humi TaxID=1688639 RepID=A0A239I3V1_9BURK|nr:Curli biogenesis system outer membrane secretion channel CsgG [Noviherbaspirillum humi]
MPSIGDNSAKTVATGSAGGATAQNASSKLEKCDKPLGTIAIVEDTTQPWFGYFRQQYQLQSTTPVLRLIVQQSNCFVVVERGRAMGNMNTERELQARGELRNGSNFGKGQMVSADYSLSPSVTISQKGTGGAGGFGGGLIGAIGSVVAAGMKSNEASTMLLMVDNRSGVQLAAAEGSAKNFDMSGGFGFLGSSFGGGAGGFTNTPQGKVLVAAFMDSYNNIVRATRNYVAQNVEGGLGKGGKLKVN